MADHSIGIVGDRLSVLPLPVLERNGIKYNDKSEIVANSASRV
ncbi:hypothetical protein EDWATA_01768 [Edwardsiella tarda ATCC 23685]|uniref:Uncharacterized protein n=1 Tax=Edwardsiella tarda ATCC 23685 TaxID=500638 RepID=D4F4U1_EDWTA|nr:hypothetical protein EDWATA_01768 [Edwardsiella tarda ATCC 23685]